MKVNGITKFDKHRENPFLNQAIDEINNNVVKKYKNASGYGEKAVLTAVDEDGEIKGHTTFIRQIEVDEEKFTKIYLANFSAFWDLNKQAIRVFGYIMGQLTPKKDSFMFFIDDCMEHTGYKAHKSIYIGLESLLKNNIIARGRIDALYFINPMVAFNGDRVTFAKSYVKKKKEKDPNQLDMFNKSKEII